MTAPTLSPQDAASVPPLRGARIAEWADLDSAIAEAEAQTAWDWRHHMALLEAKLDQLAAQLPQR